MKKLALAICVCRPVAWPLAASAAGPDPRERNFQFLVDGVEIDGIVGYRIEFTRAPTSRDDSRRLDRAYSPDQRRLVITVTQKGLNRLQDWLNGATDAEAPLAKTVTIVARDNREELLARWELTGVTPMTFSSAGAGIINQVDSTIEFSFDRLRLVEARAQIMSNFDPESRPKSEIPKSEDRQSVSVSPFQVPDRVEQADGRALEARAEARAGAAGGCGTVEKDHVASDSEAAAVRRGARRRGPRSRRPPGGGESRRNCPPR